MVAWLTAGQVRRLLQTQKVENIWLEDNEKIYLGDDKDVAIYFDGTNFIIDGSDNMLFYNAAGSRVWGFTEDANYRTFSITRPETGAAFNIRYSKTSDYLTYFTHGHGSVFLQVDSVYFYVRRQLVPYIDDYYSVGLSSHRWKDVWMTRTLKAQSVNNTTENVLEVSVDSDVITIGNPIVVLSGPTADVEVFSVSGDGSVELRNYVPADAGIPTVDSPPLVLTGHYWDGTASHDESIKLKADINSTSAPYGQLYIYSTWGGAFIVRPESGRSSVFGSTASTGKLYLHATTATTEPFIELDGGYGIHFYATAGSGLYFNVAGTTEMAVEANRIDFNGSTWYNPNSASATSVSGLSRVIVVNIAGTNYYIPAYTSYS